MIFKSLIVSALLVMGCATAEAQVADPTDAGVSVFNYKHANKAALAKTKSSANLTIPATSATNSTKQPGSFNKSNDHVTPRYKAQPASFVVEVKQGKKKAEINPLLSAHNYKAGKHYNRKSYQTTALSFQPM
jgi:hypothetical protein